MSLYLLAPIILQAAHASDQLLVVERPIQSRELICCAAVPLGGGPNHELGPMASSGGLSTADFRPAASAALDPSAGLQPASPLALAMASNAVTGPTSEAPAEDSIADPISSDGPYTFRIFRDQAKSVKWRFAGAAAVITAGGFANWNWGSSRFRFSSEGWFGEDTASLGMDKLGHAYSSYFLTEFFSHGIEQSAAHNRFSSHTGAILAMGLMTYIEVFDGFSKDHGFSPEDLVADAAGALFSVARRSVPGLRDKIDFRLLYVPSASTWRTLSCFPKPHCDHDGEAVRSPITDYSGQRYLFALKLSGFEPLKRTPLRLLELHGGYYARGFTKEEEDRGDPLKRRLFVGLGLNVAELLFPGRRRGIGGVAQWALQYLQVPYTAVHSE